MTVVRLPAGDALDAGQLRALARGETAALHLAGAVSAPVAAAMSEWIAEQPSDDYFVLTDRGSGPERIRVGVRRVGIPLNELVGANDLDAALADYLRAARSCEAGMVAACAPGPTPMATLIDVLGRAWPAGVEIASADGQPLFAGIPRIVERDAVLMESQPHVDAVHPNALPIDHQVSANLYLEVPPAGGELEVWPGEPFRIDEIFATDLHERLRREDLGASDVITPAAGDLVIINSRRPHAVRQLHDGRRFSVQCFIGMPEGDGPLVLWS
jgi:hypothetical protein